MPRKRQILVIGSAEDSCTPHAREIAYQVGVEVAKSESTLITGGLGGVMEAARGGLQRLGELL